MDTRFAFTSKAEKYARYRWDYAPEAIEAIFQIAGLTPRSAVVDIGAGTGRLTRHFAGRVEKLVAVEPNPAMLFYARESLRDFPGCTFIEAPAEATGLPDSTADLVTVGQAVHWFDSEPARREIRRILKPSGWLAVLRNIDMEADLWQAMSALATVENGVQAVHRAPSNHVPFSFYYMGQETETLTFPFSFKQDWEAFIGAAISASYNPDPDHPRFPAFEQAMREVFEKFCVNEDGQKWLKVSAETEVTIGRMGIIGQE